MSVEFWKATAVRALRTVCQTAIATIGSATLLESVSWKVVISASLLAGLLSVLTSIATGLPEVEYREHIYMSADEPEDSWIEEEGEWYGEE